jgi:flagellar motor switch protein FliM
MTAKAEPRGQHTVSPKGEQDPKTSPRPYDFTQPERLSRRQLRGLELIHQEAGSAMARKLSVGAVGQTEVQLQGISQMRAEDLVASLPQPTLVEILSLSPLTGTGILQLDLAPAFAIVNQLLGGRQNTDLPARPLTEVERVVLSDFIATLLECLAAAWHKMCAFQLSVVSAADVAHVSQLGQPQDPVLAAQFQLTAAETQGGLTFALPILPLERAHMLDFGRSEAFQETPHLDEGMLQSLRKRRAALLAALPVRCRAVLATVPLTLADLSDLRPGDLLPLRPASDLSVEVVVGGCSCFRARLLTQQRHLAVELLPDDSPPGDKP